MGSRLGFDKPKGMFDIGESKVLSIFEQQMNNIKEVTSLTGKYFPLLIMTSEQNNLDTVNFFKENNFFGYPEEKIKFFVQETAVTCDFNGKVFLDEKHKISRAPNGNGGWYSSLKKSGLDKYLKKEGVEWLNVYSVDNVLQRICDPVFIGATYLSGVPCSSKVVKKISAEERVGLLCKEDGVPTVVEYYEVPEKYAAARDESGEFLLKYGVILNYLFKVEVLEDISDKKLPFHLATKKIPHIEGGEKVVPEQPNGYKFETLVVDMIKYAGDCLAYEVEREKEFAPIKNRIGADSVESARALLKLNGVEL